MGKLLPQTFFSLVEPLHHENKASRVTAWRAAPQGLPDGRSHFVPGASRPCLPEGEGIVLSSSPPGTSPLRVMCEWALVSSSKK
jgi:hypothetical protein